MTADLPETESVWRVGVGVRVRLEVIYGHWALDMFRTRLTTNKLHREGNTRISLV